MNKKLLGIIGIAMFIGIFVFTVTPIGAETIATIKGYFAKITVTFNIIEPFEVQYKSPNGEWQDISGEFNLEDASLSVGDEEVHSIRVRRKASSNPRVIRTSDINSLITTNVGKEIRIEYECQTNEMDYGILDNQFFMNIIAPKPIWGYGYDAGEWHQVDIRLIAESKSEGSEFSIEVARKAPPVEYTEICQI